jgi:hypothetical protein
MTKTVQYGVCGLFFDSKSELTKHIDRQHRITNDKINTNSKKSIIKDTYYLHANTAADIFASVVKVSDKGASSIKPQGAAS